VFGYNQCCYHPTLLNTTFQILAISVRRYVGRYVGILLLSLLFFFHILTNTKFKHITSTSFHG
jgi:hypothetical protein